MALRRIIFGAVITVAAVVAIVFLSHGSGSPNNFDAGSVGARVSSAQTGTSATPAQVKRAQTGMGAAKPRAIPTVPLSPALRARCAAAQLAIVKRSEGFNPSTIATAFVSAGIEVRNVGRSCTFVRPRHIRVTTRSGLHTTAALTNTGAYTFRIGHGAAVEIAVNDWWYIPLRNANGTVNKRFSHHCPRPIRDVTTVSIFAGRREAQLKLKQPFRQICRSPLSDDIELRR